LRFLRRVHFACKPRAPHFASRGRYRSPLDSDLATRPDAESGYDAFSLPGSPFIAGDRVEADLHPPRDAAAHAKRYTNKVLAHRDRATANNPARISLTYGEMHTALDAVGETMRKYYSLRHPGQLLAVVTPTPSDLRFLTMFERPWLVEGYMPPNELDLG
jgi:hypothetical protein